LRELLTFIAVYQTGFPIFDKLFVLEIGLAFVRAIFIVFSFGKILAGKTIHFENV